jgi:small subunit ribosomal protein S17
MERGRLKTVHGRVISDRMVKTIVVQTERRVKHPRYGKYIRKFTTYFAHDDDSTAQNGDFVELAATRPISKKKCWRFVKVVTHAAGTRPVADESPAAGASPAAGTSPAAGAGAES